MKALHVLLLAGTATLVTAGIGLAEEFRASTWLPATDIHSRYAIGWYAEKVAEDTDKEITFQTFYGGALLPATSTLKGTGDGVAHLGFVTSANVTADLPVANALSAFQFIELDPIVLGMAYADYIMNDPVGYKDWRQHGVVPVGGFGNAPTTFHCRSATPPTSMDDLKGLRVRFPGGVITQFARDLGMIPVTMPAGEKYQASQTGQVDCASIYPTFLNIDNSLGEVTRSTLLINIGTNFIQPSHVFNAEFWRNRTTDQRQILLNEAARAMAKMEVDYLGSQATAIEMAKATGHVFAEPDQSIKDAIDQWVANGVGGMADEARNTYGIEDPEVLFASFQNYIDKWKPIVSNLNDRLDEEELTQMILTHLIAPVDAATYGMD